MVALSDVEAASVRQAISKGKLVRTRSKSLVPPHLTATRARVFAEMAKASPTYSVLSPGCPSRLVLDRIADKWTALIIQILARGTQRYSELQRNIGEISQKMLTQTLRSLERDGLVQRKVYPVVPPRVEYALTKLGRTLIEPLQGLCRWSEKHLPELQSHRARAAAAEKLKPAA